MSRALLENAIIRDWGVLLRAIVPTFCKAMAWIAGALLLVFAISPIGQFAVLLVLLYFRLVPPLEPPSWEERARIAEERAAVEQERLERALAGRPGTGRVLTPDWRCVSTIECKRLTP